MSIPALEYHGHALRGCSQTRFPPFGDPHAPGRQRIRSIVRVDTIPPTPAAAPRDTTVFREDAPQTAALALEPATQFGKDIVDGKIAPPEIRPTHRSGSAATGQQPAHLAAREP